MRSLVLLLTIACGLPTADGFYAGGQLGEVVVQPQPGDEGSAPMMGSSPSADDAGSSLPGPDAPDAGAGSGPVDGRSTVHTNMAQELWTVHTQAVSAIRELEVQQDDSYAHWVVAWVQAASSAAGHVVTAGTVTEHADQSLTYSASPSNSLVIVRSSGATFSFKVTQLVGDITQQAFPLGSDAISFTWSWAYCNLTGTYGGLTHDYQGWYSDLAGNRVDVSVHEDDDRSSGCSSQECSDYGELKSHGTVGVEGYVVTFTQEIVYGDCTGSGCFVDNGHNAQWSATLTRGSTTWTLDATCDQAWNRDTFAQTHYELTGTIEQGSNPVGSLGTRVVEQSSNSTSLIPYVRVGSDEFDLSPQFVTQ
jgi:hypothetical protein